MHVIKNYYLEHYLNTMESAFAIYSQDNKTDLTNLIKLFGLRGFNLAKSLFVKSYFFQYNLLPLAHNKLSYSHLSEVQKKDEKLAHLIIQSQSINEMLTLIKERESSFYILFKDNYKNAHYYLKKSIFETNTLLTQTTQDYDDAYLHQQIKATSEHYSSFSDNSLKAYNLLHRYQFGSIHAPEYHQITNETFNDIERAFNRLAEIYQSHHRVGLYGNIHLHLNIDKNFLIYNTANNFNKDYGAFQCGKVGLNLKCIAHAFNEKQDFIEQLQRTYHHERFHAVDYCLLESIRENHTVPDDFIMASDHANQFGLSNVFKTFIESTLSNNNTNPYEMFKNRLEELIARFLPEALNLNERDKNSLYLNISSMALKISPSNIVMYRMYFSAIQKLLNAKSELRGKIQSLVQYEPFISEIRDLDLSYYYYFDVDISSFTHTIKKEIDCRNPHHYNYFMTPHEFCARIADSLFFDPEIPKRLMKIENLLFSPNK